MANNVNRVDRLKSMHPDRYIEFMLDFGFYDVDVERGVVMNRRTGLLLSSYPNKAGHPTIVMSYNHQLLRKVMVCRVVAIKMWGVTKTRRGHIIHDDGDITNNCGANLKMSKTKAEGPVGVKAKTEWPPCVRCGDPNGYIVPTGKTPTRVRGEKYGYDGELCHKCYGLLYHRAKRVIKLKSLAEEQNRNSTDQG